jgi:hypothetical protein
MLRFTTNLFVLHLSFFSVCQDCLPLGSRSNSLGNASVTFSDVWSYHHNPGATATIRNRQFGICYQNRFLLKELQSQGVTFIQPLPKGVFSVGAQLFGFNQYRSYRVGAGYSLKLSELLFAGVQLNYQGIKLNEYYGSKNTLTAELGILTKISEHWKIGFSAFNLGRAKLTVDGSNRLTTTLRLGTSYSFSKQVLIACEIAKNDRYPLRFKSGIEYNPLKSLYFRGGVASNPIELSFGFGYKSGCMQLDLGSSYHQLLGWSPNIALTFQSKP